MAVATPETEVTTPSAATEEAPSDGAEPTPSAVAEATQDGAAPVVDGQAEAQDGSKTETTAETDNDLWARYQRSLQGDEAAGVFDPQTLSRVRNIGNRLASQENARRLQAEQREREQKALAEAEPAILDAFVKLQLLDDPTDDERTLAQFKAEKLVKPHLEKIGQAYLKPIDDDALGAIRDLLGESEYARQEDRILKLPTLQKIGMAASLLGESAKSAVPDGFISKADHEAALKALRNELEKPKVQGQPAVNGVSPQDATRAQSSKWTQEDWANYWRKEPEKAKDL